MAHVVQQGAQVVEQQPHRTPRSAAASTRAISSWPTVAEPDVVLQVERMAGACR
jgi:hypothetical protein